MIKSDGGLVIGGGAFLPFAELLLSKDGEAYMELATLSVIESSATWFETC